MRKLILTVALLALPLAARATCLLTGGPLTLQKIRLSDPGNVWVGCVNNSLDILSNLSASTSPTSSSTFGTLHVELGRFAPRC